MKNKFRYVMAICMLASTFINVIDRGALGFAQGPITKLYHLNAVGWGVINSYYGYGYFLGALVGGILADKKGSKWVWVVFGLGWCLFEGLTAFAGDLGIALFGGSVMAGFFLIRILFGISEGPVWANVNRTMYNWVAPKERAFATSIALAANPLGALITAPIIVALMIVAGWRVMFVITAVVGIIYTLVWTRYLTDRPEDNPRVSKEELAVIRDGRENDKTSSSLEKVPWYYFFRHPQLILNLLGFWAPTYIIYVVVTWIPKYLQDYYHVKLSMLGFVGMVPWILALFGVVAGGRLSDYLLRKTGRYGLARPGLVCVGLAIEAIALLLVPLVQGNMGGVLVLIMIAIGAAFFQNPIVWGIVADSSEPSMVGTYGGITTMFGQTASILAPLLTGLVIQYVGYRYMFLPGAGIAVAALIAQLFIRDPRKSAIPNSSVSISG